MNREHIQLMMNRAIDGVATPDERAQLARALRGDPLMHSEFEELQTVHASTESMFRQISLREDFSKRVMRRIQTGEVPSDSGAESVRLPAVRPLKGQRRRVKSIRKLRLYGAVAGISAAAAVLLAAGVLSGFFARAGIGTQGMQPVNPEKSTTADGRRGVPDTEELNRTDSSTHQPSANSNKATSQPKRDESPKGVQPGPEPVPEGVAIKPDQTPPVVPAPLEKPSETPEPVPEEVVKDTEPKQPEPAHPDPIPAPVKDEVVKGTTPDDGKTVAPPLKRERIGTLMVMSGKAELIAADGSASRFKDQDQEIFTGDRIRTKYNACIRLQFAGGDVTLGQDTQIILNAENELTLEAYDGKERGQLALNRESTDVGDAFEIHVEDYAVYLMHGTALIERERHGMVVSKAVGFATITHDTFGSVLLSEDGGYKSEVEFGRDYTAPTPKRVVLPDWASKSRRHAIMAELTPVITERNFSAVERNYVTKQLPAKLDALLLHGTTTESVVGFITTAIRNDKLVGADIIRLIDEVEVAYFDVSELTPEQISEFANQAALVAESFDKWKETFYRLMRPPVDPKAPASKPGSSTSTTSTPTDKNKATRVDDPPIKKTKSPTPSKENKEAEEATEETEKKDE